MLCPKNYWEGCDEIWRLMDMSWNMLGKFILVHISWYYMELKLNLATASSSAHISILWGLSSSQVCPSPCSQTSCPWTSSCVFLSLCMTSFVTCCSHLGLVFPPSWASCLYFHVEILPWDRTFAHFQDWLIIELSQIFISDSHSWCFPQYLLKLSILTVSKI